MTLHSTTTTARTHHTALRHYTHTQLSSLGFQSDRVFTCPLDRIRKGIKHPIRSTFYSDRDHSIKGVYMKTFFVNLITDRLFGCVCVCVIK